MQYLYWSKSFEPRISCLDFLGYGKELNTEDGYTVWLGSLCNRLLGI